jgi:hypothetical protein
MNIKENIGVYLILSPLFSYLVTIVSLGVIGAFVDSNWFKTNLDSDASGVFIVCNFIFATIFLTAYIIEKMKEHD